MCQATRCLSRWLPRCGPSSTGCWSGRRPTLTWSIWLVYYIVYMCSVCVYVYWHDCVCFYYNNICYMVSIYVYGSVLACAYLTLVMY